MHHCATLPGRGPMPIRGAVEFLVMKKVEESKALKFAIHFLLSGVHGAAQRCRVGFRVHAYDACRRLTDVERELVFR